MKGFDRPAPFIHESVPLLIVPVFRVIFQRSQVIVTESCPSISSGSISATDAHTISVDRLDHSGPDFTPAIFDIHNGPQSHARRLHQSLGIVPCREDSLFEHLFTQALLILHIKRDRQNSPV